MLKAKAVLENGRTLLIFGLSEMNVKKIQSGEPIHLHGEELGQPMIDIMIFSGKDEKEMYEALQPLVSVSAKVVHHGDANDFN